MSQSSQISEVIVLGVEVGCGMCVDQLLDTLRNLTELINRGLAGLPVTAPPDQVDELRVQIEDLQVGVVNGIRIVGVVGRYCCTINHLI